MTERPASEGRSQMRHRLPGAAVYAVGRTAEGHGQMPLMNLSPLRRMACQPVLLRPALQMGASLRRHYLGHLALAVTALAHL
jgi:hypothetical protein